MGFLYLIFCWDKSWKKPVDPGSIFGPHLSQGLSVTRHTIYFVRHGESTWNETFNKGHHRSQSQFLIGFIPNLIKAVLYEIQLLLTGQLDSWFYDAPLSHYGLSQVEEMAVFIKDKKIDDNDTSQETNHLKILRGTDPTLPKARLISSNLRRACATIIGGFYHQITSNKKNKIMIVPSLQEISRNPDTLSITPPHTNIKASWIEKEYDTSVCNYAEVFDNNLDMSLYTGNKPINTNGHKRMEEFCEYIFTSSSPTHKEYIIVGGHSIWFRAFFQTYLPYSVQHVSKQKKIVNCGIVVFDLMKADTKYGPKYMIDPKTIKTVYGGFEK